MRKNLNLILLALLAGVAVMVNACTSKEEPGKEPEPPKEETASITVLSGQTPVIADTGGSFTIDFSSSLPWKVTPVATWAIAEPSSGDAGEHS